MAYEVIQRGHVVNKTGLPLKKLSLKKIWSELVIIITVPRWRFVGSLQSWIIWRIISCFLIEIILRIQIFFNWIKATRAWYLFISLFQRVFNRSFKFLELLAHLIISIKSFAHIQFHILDRLLLIFQFFQDLVSLVSNLV